MFFSITAILFGLVLLVWSADQFVTAASRLAQQMQISPLLIGIFIIGLGTSAPEITVSVLASIEGNSGIALGNAFGSNITNIGLVLGCAALLRPVRVQKEILYREIPLLIGITIFTILLLSDQALTRLDGLILLCLFITFFMISALQAIYTPTTPQNPLPLVRPYSIKILSGQILGSLLLLVMSARAFVWGATNMAVLLGVSDLIIGLSIVAIGTSLPELAATIIASLRRQDALAVGNVVGSNIFNTLLVVGLSGVIQPAPLDAWLLFRDLGTTLVLTLCLFAVCWGRKGRGRILRREGLLLCSLYLGYCGFLFLTV